MDQIVAVLDNTKYPCSKRYGILRTHIEREVLIGREKLLGEVGQYLKGTLKAGYSPYWEFPDGSKAKFSTVQSPQTALAQAFNRAA